MGLVVGWRWVSRNGFPIASAVFIMGVLVLSGCEAFAPSEDLSQHIPAPGSYDVRILRDEWGVPHIFGKRDADTAYGLGFAQCEDDWEHVEEGVLVVRGVAAAVYGRDHAQFDFLVQMLRVWDFVEAWYERDVSPETRALAEGYAAGITHFAALHRDKMPHIDLPVTGKDVVAGMTFKTPFFYDMHKELEKLFAKGERVGISRKGEVAQAAPANPLGGAYPMGSNAWVVGRSRSADGAVRMAINSHMPWTGPVTFYEAHLHSDEGWNVVGGTFPGGPVIFLGHDEHKGWCHTISRPDLADVYELEVNPENENQYRFDGEWRDFERDTAGLTVRLWGRIRWTFKRELLWSVHGPCARTETGVRAIRFAGYGEVGHLDQWYRMNKAQNLDEFLAAMRRLGLLSFNTVYGDKEGNLFYAHTGRFPIRKEGYDWKGIVPGNTSETLWTDVLSFDLLPQVLNPPSDFLQSTNCSPFMATVGEANPDPAQFPDWMGLDLDVTNRARRALALYGGDPSITREEFWAYKFDKTYAEESGLVEFVNRLLDSEIPDEPRLQEAARLLGSWDRKTDRKNPAAALAVLVGEDHDQRAAWGGTPLDPVNVLREAAKLLAEHHGRLDVPWEEVMRLRRGSLDLGLGGGPDCMRALDPKLDKDGRFIGINGDCYMLMVEWDKEGQVHSEAVHQFDSATIDEASPHYADQAPLFAAEQTRPTLLTEEAVRAHLKREYRPGEIGFPWYATDDS